MKERACYYYCKQPQPANLSIQIAADRNEISSAKHIDSDDLAAFLSQQLSSTSDSDPNNGGSDLQKNMSQSSLGSLTSGFTSSGVSHSNEFAFLEPPEDLVALDPPRLERAEALRTPSKAASRSIVFCSSRA